tara:strand:+ start:35 stop:484 length:450 start_codon:yes stop_codon:yes gene_type:complete
MATRKINSFIQHLMTEAPMTTGVAGPPTEDAPRPFPGQHQQQNPNYTIPAKPIKPRFKPKPTPLDQSDRDGRTIPFFDVRIPGERSASGSQKTPRGPKDLYNNRNPYLGPIEGPFDDDDPRKGKWPKWEYEQKPDGSYTRKPILYAFSG